MAINTDKAVIIFEFKVIEGEEEDKGEGRGKGRGNMALEQIKNKRYYEKYLNSGKKIYLAGIEFSKVERNIINWVIE